MHAADPVLAVPAAAGAGAVRASAARGGLGEADLGLRRSPGRESHRDPGRVRKLEIPQDLREGYGFPQFTEQDKANILGSTLATVFGFDVEAKQQELAALPAGR